jgi:hypothetical protein
LYVCVDSVPNACTALPVHLPVPTLVLVNTACTTATAQRMLLVRLRLASLRRLYSTHTRRCFYDVLGVSAAATAADLKQAFKQARTAFLSALTQPHLHSSHHSSPAGRWFSFPSIRRGPRSCTQTVRAAQQQTPQAFWTSSLHMKPFQTPTSVPCMMRSDSTACPVSCGVQPHPAAAAAAVVSLLRLRPPLPQVSGMLPSAGVCVCGGGGADAQQQWQQRQQRQQ